MTEAVNQLKCTVGKIVQGGDEKSRKTHVSRGKLLPRDRVNTLLDPGTSFLEFSQLAGHDMYDDYVPAAGIITGIGKVQGYKLIISFQGCWNSEGRKILCP